MKTKSATMNTEPCFECDDGVLERVLVDHHSKHPKLGEFTVKKVPMERCSSCGDILLGASGNQKIDDYLDKSLKSITPAEVKEFLVKYDLTQKQAAKITGLGEKNISRWLTGHSRPSESVSNLLRIALRNEAAFNLLKENNWDQVAQFPTEHRQPNVEEKEVLKQIDFKALSELGVVKSVTKRDEKRSEICRMAQCVDLLDFKEKMMASLDKIAAFKDDNRTATALGCGLWVNLGERAANKVRTAPFDKEKLGQAIEELRELTRQPLEEVVEDVKSILARAGVALVFVPPLKGSSLRGCTRLLTKTKAMVLHGLKYKNVAQFWIVLFHELAHLLLHIKTPKDIFPEYGNPSDDLSEIEANAWAYDKLVSLDKELEFRSEAQKPEPEQVDSFAKSIKVNTAVVAEIFNLRSKKQVIKYATLTRMGMFPHLSKELASLLVESSDFS